MKPYSPILVFILAFSFLSLLGNPVVYAQTDAKTLEFLKKTNHYYYCLSREGLKGFTCEVVVKVSKPYQDSLIDLGWDKKVVDALDGQRYTLRVSGDEKPVITWINPPASTDKTYDSQLKKQAETIQANMEDTIGNWVEATMEPGFDETGSKGNCQVTHTKDGFVVAAISSEGSSVDMYFDQKSRINKIIVSQNGKQVEKESVTVVDGPTGYLWEIVTVKSLSSESWASSHYFYGKVGKYLLLKSTTKDFPFGNRKKKGSSITLDFMNYQLSE